MQATGQAGAQSATPSQISVAIVYAIKTTYKNYLLPTYENIIKFNFCSGSLKAFPCQRLR